MTRRRWIAAAAVLLLLIAAAGVAALAATGRLTGPVVEDCDSEDYANREAECGFGPASSKPKASKSPKPQTTRK